MTHFEKPQNAVSHIYLIYQIQFLTYGQSKELYVNNQTENSHFSELCIQRHQLIQHVAAKTESC